MRCWIDAQLPPSLAHALRVTYGVEAEHVFDLGLVTASDEQIFGEARHRDVVVLTKDADFVRLLKQLGPPPRVLWITIGNSTNADLREVILAHWHRVVGLFESGESLVEIGRVG